MRFCGKILSSRLTFSTFIHAQNEFIYDLAQDIPSAIPPLLPADGMTHTQAALSEQQKLINCRPGKKIY